jgi:hypothetical protein
MDVLLKLARRSCIATPQPRMTLASLFRLPGAAEEVPAADLPSPVSGWHGDPKIWYEEWQSQGVLQEDCGPS